LEKKEADIGRVKRQHFQDLSDLRGKRCEKQKGKVPRKIDAASSTISSRTNINTRPIRHGKKTRGKNNDCITIQLKTNATDLDTFCRKKKLTTHFNKHPSEVYHYAQNKLRSETCRRVKMPAAKKKVHSSKNLLKLTETGVFH
jgi:hypothetical protein